MEQVHVERLDHLGVLPCEIKVRGMVTMVKPLKVTINKEVLPPNPRPQFFSMSRGLPKSALSLAPRSFAKKPLHPVVGQVWFQCGEGWHSNENAVRFWNSSPRIPKETHSRCYASATAYVMMIPPCNSCSRRSKRPRRWRSSSWPCGR